MTLNGVLKSGTGRGKFGSVLFYGSLTKWALPVVADTIGLKKDSHWVPVAHICNKATWEAEIWRIEIRGQPWQIVGKTLSISQKTRAKWTE
jgi:hypothetical protein